MKCGVRDGWMVDVSSGWDVVKGRVSWRGGGGVCVCVCVRVCVCVLERSVFCIL